METNYVQTSKSWNSYANNKKQERKKANSNKIWARHLSFGIPRAYKHCMEGEDKEKFKPTNGQWMRKQLIKKIITNDMVKKVSKNTEKLKYHTCNVTNQKTFTKDGETIKVKCQADCVAENKKGEKILIHFDNHHANSYGFKEEEGFSLQDKIHAKYIIAILDDIDYVRHVYLNRDTGDMMEEEIKVTDKYYKEAISNLMDEAVKVKKCIKGEKDIEDYSLREEWMKKYSPFMEEK